jgi:transposase
MDLRVRVMADVDGGLGTKAAAQKYRVSEDWIRKLKRLRRETGSFAARQQRVSHATKLDNDLPRLEQLVKERPDATLKELRAALGCEASVSCIWRALRRLQMTFKKSSSGRGAAATRRAGAARRVESQTTWLAGPSSGVH